MSGRHAASTILVNTCLRTYARPDDGGSGFDGQGSHAKRGRFAFALRPAGTKLIRVSKEGTPHAEAGTVTRLGHPAHPLARLRLRELRAAREGSVCSGCLCVRTLTLRSLTASMPWLISSTTRNGHLVNSCRGGPYNDTTNIPSESAGFRSGRAFQDAKRRAARTGDGFQN